MAIGTIIEVNCDEQTVYKRSPDSRTRNSTGPDRGRGHDEVDNEDIQ